MKNLLHKEFALAIHPMVWFFSLLGALILVPTYPNSVFVIYVMMSFIFLFQGGRENNDLFYSILLPVKKSDVVKARFASIATFELLSILIASLSGIATYFMGYGETGKRLAGGIGIPPTPAFFGLVFLSFAIFNAIFLNLHYRKGFKMLVPMILASTIGFLPLLFGEVFASLGSTPLSSLANVLSSVASNAILPSLLILFGGIVAYLLSLFLTFRACARTFEKMDL